MIIDAKKLLYCIKCKANLKNFKHTLNCEKCHEKYEVIDKNIFKFTPELTPDIELSIEKWDEFYKKQLKDKSYLKVLEKNEEFKKAVTNLYEQLNEHKSINKDLVYLEIGCGTMVMGQEIADKCKLVIGIDFCPSALKIAKKMFELRGIKNYLLLQGNILTLPLKNETVDLINGGGVIEHFKNTQKCVNELYRVLKKGGVSFNSVPSLNLATIYRQTWGNIPNFPVLKQLAEFVHIRLLKKKHMIFGYELSFLPSTLKKIHKKAGFKKVIVDKFDVGLVFDFLPKFLKKPCIWLSNNCRLFWAMVKVIGKK